MASSVANVNKPMDTKQKDADVNRKLQIYGIISAFQNGKLPSVCHDLSPHTVEYCMLTDALYHRTTKSTSP